jgi:hypothetical protein
MEDDDDDDNSDALHHLLTGRGPVMDELSICSVPAGSLLSSTQDLAVAGSSCRTPATVTSGAYLEDSSVQPTSTRSVQGMGLYFGNLVSINVIDKFNFQVNVPYDFISISGIHPT